MDQRLGGKKEPYAASTIFGWTSFGTPHATNHKPLSVKFTTTAGNDAIEQALQTALAVRIAKQLRQCFRIFEGRVTFWTDFATVKHYVNNFSSRFSIFVSNRLTVVYEETKVHQWRYVKPADNPADHCSRGLNSLDKLRNWLGGPTFLTAASKDENTVLVPPAPVELIEAKRVIMTVERDIISPG
ncbi:unnamed protein product [Echinostoma caproni]|uniref:RT_RNaseH domain-containing protein n=1 Tax=Echinostoma caproni TaxID=27848 RepID=A0A183BAX6_9TREM|nr:unnamed protein product [Echinostoma caproni]